MTDFQATDRLTEKKAEEAFDLAYASHREGRLLEAYQQYMVLIEQYPDSALLRYNLGLVYFEKAEYSNALNEFTLACSLGPEDDDTLFNLALCQKKTGDYPSAIATYERILTIHPGQLYSLYNLAGCYRHQQEYELAIACYKQVLEIDPSYLPAIKNIAYVNHQSGKNEYAIYYYKKVLEQQPKNESISYLLSALAGVHLDHAPESYIRDLFNDYAHDFEHSLIEELGYDSPRQLYDCLGRSEASKVQSVHGLDLGCGTGLSGLAFGKIVTSLDGVDLSERMLIQAAEKGCYDHIHQDSIIHHLATTNETYDFFLAADVFIYIGDLLPVFSLAWDIARPDALFCFSTERLDTGEYRLLPTGRFAYTPEYIRQAAAATGWMVLTHEYARLRMERDQWLMGDLWVIRRLVSCT